MTANQYIKEENKKDRKDTGARGSRFGRWLSDMLDGSLITRSTSASAMPFILYLSAFALFLIFNAYYAEKKAREVDKLRIEMTELRIRHVRTKSEYMYMTRQSELARSLNQRGFVEATQPPVLIYKQEEKGFLGRLFR